MKFLPWLYISLKSIRKVLFGKTQKDYKNMVIILSKLYYNKKITVKNRWPFLKHTVKGYKNHLKYWLVYEKKFLTRVTRFLFVFAGLHVWPLCQIYLSIHIVIAKEVLSA